MHRRRVLDIPLNTCRLEHRQIRALLFEAWDERPGLKSPVIYAAEKQLLNVELELTVPQTDTGRRGEYPKVFERILVKELGKMTP